MRIGIVNDLALIREALRRVVESDPRHRVAWVACDGAEAVDRAGSDRPDLILMDLIMPGVDGVEATRRIMARSPCPILIVTSSVGGHLGRVYEAMGLGALDAVDTPELGPDGGLDGAKLLIGKMATIAKLIGRPPPTLVDATPPRDRPSAVEEVPGWHLVAIGSSLGGPAALAEVLGSLPPLPEAAVVIVQHVDSAFAPGLARWLGERTGRKVELVEPGARPKPGRTFLAATDDHVVLDDARRLRYVAEPTSMSYRPSVDVFLRSVAEHWPTPGTAAILTGMGRDGAAGLLTLRRLGWLTIAQDEATSVVWGMPGAAVEVGAAQLVLPLPSIAEAIAARVLGAPPGDNRR